MTRVIHKAKLIDQNGNVSALCFKTPHAVNLKKEGYIMYPPNYKNVTCPKCKKLLEEADGN